jgi:PAS domain S-box-containing protein
MPSKYAPALAAAIVVAFAGWMLLQVGGAAATADFEDVIQTCAALAACVACGRSARRGRGSERVAWGLIALGTLGWALSDSARAASLLATGNEPPYPSLSDVGFFSAIPLEISGAVAFVASITRVTMRARAFADGATLSFCVLFIAWAIVYRDSQLTTTAALLSFGPPAGDIVTGTLLAPAVLRMRKPDRWPYLLLLGGFASLLVSDLAFGFLNVIGGYFANLLNTGWVAGFLLIALAAARWRSEPVAAEQEGPIAKWQMVLVWSGLVGVLITGATLILYRIPSDPTLAFIAGAIGVSVIAAEAVWYFDSTALLEKTRQAERTLRERTNLLEQIVNHSPVGIARWNKEFAIIDANPGLGALLRKPTASLIGSSVGAYLETGDQPGLRAKLAPLLTGEIDTVEGEANAIRADGSRVWTQWIATAIKNSAGRIDYFLTMLLDADARHKAELEAKANMEDLERLNRAKSEVVSMISHEMRTALTGIQGFSEVMQTQPVTSDEVKEIAGDINTDATRLNRMVSEMLDLDRLESGRATLTVGPVDLNALVHEAVLRGTILGPKHHIFADVDPELPVINGDSDRLFQVILNLVSNAIKYSPPGDVLIATRHKDGHVALSVTDHGPGIAAEFVDRLFKRYERYEGSARRVIGTGLGLVICRQIIEMHGGRIWVESAPGDGSVFQFEIPTPS